MKKAKNISEFKNLVNRLLTNFHISNKQQKLPNNEETKFLFNNLTDLISSENTLVESTYQELLQLKAENKLVAGQKYLMPVFQTLHIIPNTTDRNDVHKTKQYASGIIGINPYSVPINGELSIKDINGDEIFNAQNINDQDNGGWAFDWLEGATTAFNNLGYNVSSTMNVVGDITLTITATTDGNSEFEFDFGALVESVIINGFHEAKVIPSEPLLLTAISTSEFDRRVISLLHPDDEILYDITGETCDVEQPEDATGWIYQRTVTAFTNPGSNLTRVVTAMYDIRHCVLRTWHCDLSGYTLNSKDTDIPILYNTTINTATPTTAAGYNIPTVQFTTNGNYTDVFTLYDDTTCQNWTGGAENATLFMPVLSANVAFVKTKNIDGSFYESGYRAAGDFRRANNVRLAGSPSIGIANTHIARGIFYPSNIRQEELGIDYNIGFIVYGGEELMIDFAVFTTAAVFYYNRVRNVMVRVEPTITRPLVGSSWHRDFLVIVKGDVLWNTIITEDKMNSPESKTIIDTAANVYIKLSTDTYWLDCRLEGLHLGPSSGDKPVIKHKNLVQGYQSTRSGGLGFIDYYGILKNDSIEIYDCDNQLHQTGTLVNGVLTIPQKGMFMSEIRVQITDDITINKIVAPQNMNQQIKIACDTSGFEVTFQHNVNADGLKTINGNNAVVVCGGGTIGLITKIANNTHKIETF